MYGEYFGMNEQGITSMPGNLSSRNRNTDCDYFINYTVHSNITQNNNNVNCEYEINIILYWFIHVGDNIYSVTSIIVAY